jgi:hypothetical protein
MNLLALYHILETTLSLACSIFLSFFLVHVLTRVHGAYIMSVNELLATEIEMEKILAPALFTVFLTIILIMIHKSYGR